MDEQDKKPQDVENMSDEEFDNLSEEELEKIAGGVILSPELRAKHAERLKAERAEFLKNGGTNRGWFMRMSRMMVKK